MQEEYCIKFMKIIWRKEEGKASSAQRASMGILTQWDSNRYESISAIENHHWIFVELKDLNNQEDIWIRNVYGPTNQGCKYSFQTHLENKKYGKMQHQCIIVRYFNTTIFLDKRRGATKIIDPYKEMLDDLTNAWSLTDIKHK